MDSGAQLSNRQDECIGVDKSEAYCVNDVVAERYSNAMPMDKIGGRAKKWSKRINITLQEIKYDVF